MAGDTVCTGCYGSGREGHGEACGCCGGSGRINDDHARWLAINQHDLDPHEQTDDELLAPLEYRGWDTWWGGKLKNELRRRLKRRDADESSRTMEVPGRSGTDAKG